MHYLFIVVDAKRLKDFGELSVQRIAGIKLQLFLENQKRKNINYFWWRGKETTYLILESGEMKDV